MTLTADDQKRAAGEAALDFVREGMKIGLGTGSTAAHFVRALGARVREGLTVSCAATSRETEKLAEEVGLSVSPLEDLAPLDLAVDGADELDGALQLIKGGGAALLREKIVETASATFVVIADESKVRGRLGAFPLPVEIVQFGAPVTIGHMVRALGDLGYDAPRMTLREKDGARVLTDGGNWIVDCHLGEIADAPALARSLSAIPGVVEHGLFLEMADVALIGQADGGVRRIEAGRVKLA